MKNMNKASQVPKPVVERSESEKQRMRRLLKEYLISGINKNQIDHRGLTMELNNPSQILWCSVCDKTQHEVTYLVAGERINICSECVARCNGLIEERKMKELFQIPAANDSEY